LPGEALASAIRSCSDFAGTFGLTAMMLGVFASRVTGAKLDGTWNGRCLYRL
jgi:hypothetical protein